MDDGLNKIIEAKSQMDSVSLPAFADVIEEIERILKRYIIFISPGLALLIAVWIAGTYLYERFQYFGYLALRSATPRCGKTRVLRILSLLCSGTPPITTIPTAAALFRSKRPVLILDEVDRLRNADKETYGGVLAVLNGGFEAGQVVERVERIKGGFVTKSYPVYGPKALAGIETLADTLADRSFQIEMKRATKRTPRLNTRKLSTTAQQIRERLELYAGAYGDEIQSTYENLPDELPTLRDYDDRLQDIAESLMVIAVIADTHRPHGSRIAPRLLEGLKAAAGRRQASSRETELIALMEILHDRLDGVPEVFIPSNELLELCRHREELSRIETTRSLAGFLKNFDLYPGANSSKTIRGYTISRDWLEEWKGRYGTRE